LFWFIIFLIALGVELLTTALISIWFAIGAGFALGASFMGASLTVQGVVFIGMSVLYLILTKPYAEKYLLRKSDVQKTNVDALVGLKCYVTSEISNLDGKGEVKLDGKFWTARHIDDTIIPISELVVVERIEGVKLIVSKAKEAGGETE
jgi:membrane protein implicated in regulation of membrane protease activity